MSARKSERIMNLAICLLMARRFIDKAQIRDLVQGYSGLSDAAFERAFERDKDELRSMGVPVETGVNSALFPDEVGYRIRRQDFELPPIEFTPAETTALGLAAQVWDSATQAEHATSALAKLRAAGVDPEPAPSHGLAPTVGAREPGFEPLWQATTSRTPVRFDYRGQEREVEPWAMAFRRGAWYLLGQDRARAAPRVFKVARIEGDVRPVGRPGSFAAPSVDMTGLLATLEPSRPDAEAVLAIRGGRAPELRRRGLAVDSDRDLPPGFQAYRVSYARRGDMIGEVCAHGPDVLVLAPDELRRGVRKHLAVVAGQSV